VIDFCFVLYERVKKHAKTDSDRVTVFFSFHFLIIRRQITTNVPRIVALVSAQEHLLAYPCRYSRQPNHNPKQFLKDCALIFFFKFLCKKIELINQMCNQNSCINILDYEGQNPWHPLYMPFTFWVYITAVLGNFILSLKMMSLFASHLYVFLSVLQNSIEDQYFKMLY